jgi:hypothetical protein
METRDDVKQLKRDVKQLKWDATWQKRAMQALLDHNGIGVDDVGEDDV